MEKPKGILVAIGGGEDKERKKDILRKLLDYTDKKKPLLEVITTATSAPEEVGDEYLAAFGDLEAKAEVINIETREEASLDKYISRIEKCDAVYFTGGNQLKLTTVLGGTEIIKAIKERYRREHNFVVAGTSAGAAVMSGTMIVSGSSQDALIKGELQLNSGFGFIQSLFIDTHFTQRGRFGRLMQTIAANPSVLGVGLGEDTAIVIHNGNKMKVIGSGLVGIVDGMNIKYTNLTEISDGDPITVEGLTVHVLSEGQSFSIEERCVLRKKKEN